MEKLSGGTGTTLDLQRDMKNKTCMIIDKIMQDIYV